MGIEWANVHFVIQCVGMADATMWSFETPGEWQLVHVTPGSILVPQRIGDDAPAWLEEVLFLANCIAFDHDMPTVVRPSADLLAAQPPPVMPVISGAAQQHGAWYFDAVTMAMEMASEIRFSEPVVLRYDDNHLDLTQFQARLGDRLEALGLYAMATRQADVLAEYLCLYRVLEAADQRNGTTFAAGRLGALKDHDFGTLRVQPFPGDAADAFAVYRERALARIAALRGDGLNDQQVADHLYGLRCGLAHGKHGRNAVLVHDFDAAVTAVAQDLPIVKLLARLAVEAP